MFHGECYARHSHRNLVMVDQSGPMLAEEHYVGGDARRIPRYSHHCPRREPLPQIGGLHFGVPDEHGLYNPGEFPYNVNIMTSDTATAVPNPSDTSKRGVPCYAQCVARLVISDNRDCGHSHRRSHISADETAGPVMLVISCSVTSWKPWGFAPAPSTRTQTLSWALPGSTRTGSASS